jgi:hypothetical protein
VGCVVCQNGIPFWYFQRHGGEHEGRTVETVDPGGLIKAAINPQQVRKADDEDDDDEEEEEEEDDAGDCDDDDDDDDEGSCLFI